MNNAKMWLVVPPAVGVPLFLSAVAVGSFSVHVAVLTNTSWVGDFLKGQPLGSGDEMASKAITPDANKAVAAYTVPADDGVEVTVIMPDGSAARAVLLADEVLASANGASPRLPAQ